MLPARVAAQEKEIVFDEVIVTLQGESIGMAEIQALVIGQDVYLPVSDFFNFLTIKNSLSASGDSISGHILTPKDVYSINRTKNYIFYRDTITHLQNNDLIFSSNEFYLNSKYLSSIFGLKCSFNFRSLTVHFKPTIELPFMREKRLEQMRRNITKVKGDIKADTIIKRKFEAWKLGAVDWNVVSGQYKGSNTVLARVGIGALVAGGEATANFYLSSNVPLAMRNQFFLWRYVNNESKLFKQISIGKLHAPGTYSPVPSVNGLQINNSPTRQRRSFGSYLLSDMTEPGWIVELYVNDVLVNYTKADASGLFSFEVPLVYGNTNVKYKFYGLWGEERSSEQVINIPFAFLPKNKLEYSFTTGIIADSSKPFTRAHANYGVSNRITIGSGIEYNSVLNDRQAMPFTNISARVGNAVILFGEYAPGTLLKAVGNLRLKNKLQLEAMIIDYAAGQQAIRTASLIDKKIMVSLPLRIKNITAFNRLTFNHSKFYKGELKTAEWLMSASKGRLNANITTAAYFFYHPEITSRLSMNFMLPFSIRFNPQVQYHYQQKNIVMIKAEAEKRAFGSMLATVGYEYNKLTGLSGFSFGLRHNFSFAQVGVSSRQVGKDWSFTQAASGGLLLDGNFKNITASDRSTVGRGTILIIPFLDYNSNGIQDKDEPEVLNLNVRVDGCKVERSFNKAAIKISALEAYNKYYLQLDDKSFDNPAYRIKHKVIEITAEPNIIKKIAIPVAVVGEVGGYVYKGGEKGIGRIIVNIYNEQNQFVAKTLTEQDGYFSYLGLAPGKYSAFTDKEQLNKIAMRNSGAPVGFEIKQNKEGDIVDNLKIYLQ